MSAVYVPLLLSALSLLICIFSILYFRSYLKRRTSQERILAEMREEVNNILRSINETTDRDISLIEERERNLKILLEEIDKRLKLYIRELESRRGAEETYTALSQKAPEQAAPPAQSYQELGKNRYRRANRQPDLIAAETASAYAAGSDSAFPLPDFSVKPGAETVPEPSLGERIRSLVREGFAPPAIASRLGISIAEVEFTTALLERRGAK